MNVITYEQPLNERVRMFLRLEDLVRRFDHGCRGEQAWETHAAMSTLVELHNLTSRVDIKRDIMKELERQTANLLPLGAQPGVDRSALEAIVARQRMLVERLHATEGQQDVLKTSEFFNSIRQRMAIPGGTCDFDLPSYHYWLHRPHDERLALLGAWIQPFREVMQAVTLILELVRQSTYPRQSVAQGGFYQQSLDQDAPFQLLRIRLPMDETVFPEVSAGRHRFTVRFLEHGDPNQRAKQTERDVNFELACCAI